MSELGLGTVVHGITRSFSVEGVLRTVLWEAARFKKEV
jgi:hypothetical protein